jgi:hypothetical protein
MVTSMSRRFHILSSNRKSRYMAPNRSRMFQKMCMVLSSNRSSQYGNQQVYEVTIGYSQVAGGYNTV